MEKTSRNLAQVRDRFDTTREWIQLRRRVLQFNTIVLLIILSMVMLVMSVGSTIQAIVAAHQPFMLVAPIAPIVVTITSVLPIVGFIGLAIFSYFTNLSQQSNDRRELIVDAIVLAMAAVVPQVIFRAAWIATTHYIVTSRDYIVTTEMLVNNNLQWLLTIGLGITAFVLGWILRRTLYEPTVIDDEDEIDYSRQGGRNQARRVYE
jgi:hypothetical protein